MESMSGMACGVRGQRGAGRREVGPSVVAAVVWALAMVLLSGASIARAQEQRFATLVGPVRVGEVRADGPIQVPYITWGGDVPTFVANGGLTTQPQSAFAELGLNVNLVAGDDFVGQVRRYLSGESPFLRGELRMLGLASEVIGSDPRTKPVVFLQLTWSAGDHMVSRPGVRTLNDLKGKRIALQRGGPHVGMLDDVLRASALSWKDITVVWADALTGPGGPADLFRKDATIDACFVITPDMLGLTGGLEAVGTGAEGTVKDARVLISTATMSRSIADVYAVRKDFYDANRAWVEKFAAGYLRATERVVGWRGAFTGNAAMDPQYKAALEMAQRIFGPEVLPTLEVDAHGLLLDATFVGLPGNRAFFEDKGNLDGFEAKQRAALDLAVGQGYAGVRAGFFGPEWDWDQIAKIGGLTVTRAGGGPRFDAEAVEQFADQVEAKDTILSFTITFEPNQTEFSADVYGPEFQRALQSASTFGNAVIAIRGHADPSRTIANFVEAGMAKGILQRSGQRGNFKYFLNKEPFDITRIDQIEALIRSGALDGVEPDARQTMTAAKNLSLERANKVRDAIAAFAKERGVRLDLSQVQPVGVGVVEPLVARPRNIDEAKQNMRVEFRLIRVPAEAIEASDFDF